MNSVTQQFQDISGEQALSVGTPECQVPDIVVPAQLCTGVTPAPNGHESEVVGVCFEGAQTGKAEDVTQPRRPKLERIDLRSIDLDEQPVSDERFALKPASTARLAARKDQNRQAALRCVPKIRVAQQRGESDATIVDKFGNQGEVGPAFASLVKSDGGIEKVCQIAALPKPEQADALHVALAAFAPDGHEEAVETTHERDADLTEVDDGHPLLLPILRGGIDPRRGLAFGSATRKRATIKAKSVEYESLGLPDDEGRERTLGLRHDDELQETGFASQAARSWARSNAEWGIASDQFAATLGW